MSLPFGTERSTKTIDDNGSTETLETNYNHGKVIGRMRIEKRIKVKVHSQKEEDMAILDWQQERNGKHDAAIKIERNKQGDEQGYYFVVKCWTELL